MKKTFLYAVIINFLMTTSLDCLVLATIDERDRYWIQQQVLDYQIAWNRGDVEGCSLPFSLLREWKDTLTGSEWKYDASKNLLMEIQGRHQEMLRRFQGFEMDVSEITIKEEETFGVTSTKQEETFRVIILFELQPTSSLEKEGPRRGRFVQTFVRKESILKMIQSVLFF